MEQTTQNIDELVLKLLHYFVTEQGYNPIVLHGAQNEIWLENLESPYKVVRIVTNYIHNDEQLDFDLFKTKQIMKKIKRKTFSLNLNALSIFLNLGDNVHKEKITQVENISCVNMKSIQDLKEYRFVIDAFPTITTENKFKEEGEALFFKISKDLNEKNLEEARHVEEIFTPKKPYVTYALIFINVLVFLAMYIFGNGSQDILTLLYFGANYRGTIVYHEFYRLITCAFLHIGVFHLLFNCYALYIIGPQLESYFGKVKYLIIYLGSAITASLMSIIFSDSISAGASGAIFGLFGALLFFGYHYRVYLGSVLKSQVIPLIIFNLLFGFTVSGIDNAAHIGGLLGGVLFAMASGIKYRSSTSEKVRGIIMTIIYIVFLFMMCYRAI